MLSVNTRQLNKELDSSQWPVFTETELTEDIAKLKFITSPELVYFSGHFPEQAVLPGVVQVHWAGELARQLFACDGFSTMNKVKFNGVILPSIEVTLSLKFNRHLNRVGFCYEDDQQKFSSGVLSFRGTM